MGAGESLRNIDAIVNCTSETGLDGWSTRDLLYSTKGLHALHSSKSSFIFKCL